MLLLGTKYSVRNLFSFRDSEVWTAKLRYASNRGRWCFLAPSVRLRKLCIALI